MNTTVKAALAAHLAHNGITLVHIWRTGDRYSAMMETGDTPTTGVGRTEIDAVLHGLKMLGKIDIRASLFMLDYMLGLLLKAVK